MAVTAATDNAQWEAHMDKATKQQQELYEMLSEWTIYGTEDYKCLKAAIGISIFGPPTPTKENFEADTDSDCDFSEMYAYDEKQTEVINHIFEQVCKYGKGYKSQNDICFGIIYNVLFPTKEELIARAKKKKETENNDEVGIALTPIFKIRKYNNKYVGYRVKVVCVQDETWYIDISGRVYQSWKQYTENNTLPKCTMVLPKLGIYQADPSQPITETSSVVWLQVQDSPNSSILKRVCSYIDHGSTATGVISIAIVGASFFTPVGPVLGAAGLIGNGISGGWTFYRSAAHLVDRGKHKQTVAPTNRETIGPWLGLVGSATGLAANGSTAMLTKVAQTGKEAGKVAKLACNAVIGSNLAINGVGLVYQGVCLIQQYKEEETLNKLDVLLFASHVFFFSHAVMNAQFANDIIKSTQGKILDEYRSSIRSKNLRKAFNRAQKAASQNSSSTLSQNAEVIRYINNKKSANMQSAAKVQSSIANLNKAGVKVQLDNGILTVDGLTMLDPMKIAGSLILSATSVIRAANDNNYTVLECLQKLASEFVESIFGQVNSSFSQHAPSASEFSRTLNDISSEQNPEQLLRLLFNIVFSLLQGSESLKSHLVEAVHFVWQYAKCHLQQFARSCNSSSDIYKILISILEVIEVLAPTLLCGCQTYINGLYLFR